MAAVQGGLVDAADKKDIKTEPSEDGGGNNNNNANEGRLLSPSPSSTSSGGSNSNTPAGAPVDQQTLLAVLQFLKKNKLSESVEILRREAGLPEDSLELKAGDPSAASSGGAAGNANLEAVDASSLLSRVSVSSSAAAQAPTKGRYNYWCETARSENHLYFPHRYISRFCIKIIPTVFLIVNNNEI